MEDGIVCMLLFCLDWFYFFSFSLLGMEMGRLMREVNVVALCVCDCCLGSIPRNHIASPARIRLQK